MLLKATNRVYPTLAATASCLCSRPFLLLLLILLLLPLMRRRVCQRALPPFPPCFKCATAYWKINPSMLKLSIVLFLYTSDRLTSVHLKVGRVLFSHYFFALLRRVTTLSDQCIGSFSHADISTRHNKTGQVSHSNKAQWTRILEY